MADAIRALRPVYNQGLLFVTDSRTGRIYRKDFRTNDVLLARVMLEVREATGQARLLGETKGALGPESGIPAAPPGETLRPVLESLLAKLEQLGERPIEVSVTTLLDGRQVARSVYRDLRERKIKNYETL